MSVQISSIVGFEVRPNESSTLLDMLMAGLSEFSDRLVQHGGKHTGYTTTFFFINSIVFVYVLCVLFHC